MLMIESKREISTDNFTTSVTKFYITRVIILYLESKDKIF